jgi:hypothetical protein
LVCCTKRNLATLCTKAQMAVFKRREISRLANDGLSIVRA